MSQEKNVQEVPTVQMVNLCHSAKSVDDNVFWQDLLPIGIGIGIGIAIVSILSIDEILIGSFVGSAPQCRCNLCHGCGNTPFDHRDLHSVIHDKA